MAFPRRPSAVLRFLFPAICFTVFFYLLSRPTEFSARDGAYHDDAATVTSWWRLRTSKDQHPIDGLIRAADQEFKQKIAKRTHTVKDAAAAYRKRRGRHPPPGFDRWFEYARVNDAVIVEDFWDQIYHDMEPFWALDPAVMRKDARQSEMIIQVRDGKALTESTWFWAVIWVQMVQSIEHMLPDMDIALNPMDEPRIVVPWEEMQGFIKKAAKTRKMASPKKVVSAFAKLPPPGEETDQDVVTPEQDWEEKESMFFRYDLLTRLGLLLTQFTEHYWLIARRGCPPNSPARTAEVVTDFSKPPEIASSFSLEHMRSGYVANYTLSTIFCHQPDLQALEGIFVEPISTKATRTLFPLFGGSKLAVNNEILLPAPMYWEGDERFTGRGGASTPWASKTPTAVWRGVATGGRNRASNWRAFQRHRFVAMSNGTKLSLAESGAEQPANFALPDKRYGLSAQQHAQTGPSTSLLGEWTSSWSNIGFTDLMCDPSTFPPPSEPDTPNPVTCEYTTPHFAIAEGVPMADQFRHKILPDIDGNSFSGRYLGFLRSTSLPVKATLWREWHDSRLVAWRHFVPMDNRFGDWWGIVEYFLGGVKTTTSGGSSSSTDGKGGADRVGGGGGGAREGRDDMAEKIAMEGREWAERVLRREDMLVYVFRLLLEYARVVDERREVMGWVEDLL